MPEKQVVYKMRCRFNKKFKFLNVKLATVVILLLLSAMPVMSQTVYQDDVVTVTVNDTSKGTVTVVHPTVAYDTLGDVVDTVMDYGQWLFIPVANDSTASFDRIVVELFGDSSCTDTLFDAFYYFDTTYYDSLIIHVYFYASQLGFPDIYGSDMLTVYPNPTGSVVSFSHIVAAPVYVFDSRGKIILTTYNTRHVDLTNLPSGMYFIRAKGYTCRVLKL